MNLANFLARSARTFPDNPAVSQGENVWISYGNLMRRVAARGGGFRPSLGRGSREFATPAVGDFPPQVWPCGAAWRSGAAVRATQPQPSLARTEIFFPKS